MPPVSTELSRGCNHPNAGQSYVADNFVGVEGLQSLLYVGASFLRIHGSFFSCRTLITAQSIFLAIALSGCEISPEQVKFRDPPERDLVHVVSCSEGDCPDTAGSPGKLGAPVN